MLYYTIIEYIKYTIQLSSTIKNKTHVTFQAHIRIVMIYLTNQELFGHGKHSWLQIHPLPGLDEYVAERSMP